MGKLLKVLVVFIFILSIVALLLGTLNFRKKEMLIGRAHELEDRIIKLAGTLEEKDPVFEGVAAHPPKDVDAVTARMIDVPNTSDFWDSYNNVLEVTGTPTMNLSTEQNRLRLRQYYYVDGMGNVEKDPLTGAPRREGPGTMDELLKSVQERANAQYATLNRTRSELVKVRAELAATIRELNTEKKQRRQNMVRINELENDVRRLEGEKTDLNRKINQLEREKTDLNDRLVEMETELGTARENFDDLKKQFAILEKKYQDLLTGPVETGGGRVAPAESVGTVSPGVKGTVMKSDPDWAFVILRLTDEAIAELIGPEGDQPLPHIELMVRRPGGIEGTDGFVTRVKLKSVKLDGSNLALADNMQNWEQVPVSVNDEVFF